MCFLGWEKGSASEEFEVFLKTGCDRQKNIPTGVTPNMCPLVILAPHTDNLLGKRILSSRYVLSLFSLNLVGFSFTLVS